MCVDYNMVVYTIYIHNSFQALASVTADPFKPQFTHLTHPCLFISFVFFFLIIQIGIILQARRRPTGTAHLFLVANYGTVLFINVAFFNTGTDVRPAYSGGYLQGLQVVVMLVMAACNYSPITKPTFGILNLYLLFPEIGGTN